MKKYVKASGDSDIRFKINNTVESALADGPNDTTYWVDLDYDDAGNQWAIVFGWIDDGEGNPLFCGKVAYLPKNSGMSEYDMDWMMPYDENTGDVWDTEISIDSVNDSDIDWLLEQWDEIKREYVDNVDFYYDTDAEIDLMNDNNELDDIWESTNVNGSKKVVNASEDAVSVDMWYGDDIKDVDGIDVSFYDNDCEYRGNLYKNNKPVGDFRTKDSTKLVGRFPQFDWAKIWYGETE